MTHTVNNSSTRQGKTPPGSAKLPRHALGVGGCASLHTDSCEGFYVRHMDSTEGKRGRMWFACGVVEVTSAVEQAEEKKADDLNKKAAGDGPHDAVDAQKKNEKELSDGVEPETKFEKQLIADRKEDETRSELELSKYRYSINMIVSRGRLQTVLKMLRFA